MSTLLDEALRILRGLPEDMQAVAARSIIDYASSYEDEQHA